MTGEVDQLLAGLHLPPLPDPLPRPVLDSHTHLDATADHSGLTPPDNLRAAGEVGVRGVVQVGCDVAGSRWAVEFARRQPNVIATVAIHPNDAARMSDAELAQALTQIAALARADERVRGVGETGLDYYRTRDEAGRARQRTSLAAHIRLAQETGRTLVIHDRDAHADILRVLDEQGWPERVVMHCFSGDAEHAQRCLAHGAWLSFPGTLTFKGNDPLRQAAAITPADRLLVETDAPYLTPVPTRGRPNASYLLAHTVRFLAGVRGVELAELCDQLSGNTLAAFGGGWGLG